MISIHENPSDNTASVKAEFVSSDFTPFGRALLNASGKEEYVKEKNLKFIKMTNGWQLCEKN